MKKKTILEDMTPKSNEHTHTHKKKKKKKKKMKNAEVSRFHGSDRFIRFSHFGLIRDPRLNLEISGNGLRYQKKNKKKKKKKNNNNRKHKSHFCEV